MGRCRRYWYEVVDAFLSQEEAYHRRRSGMHDETIVLDGFVYYLLCGNVIAAMPLDKRFLYIRTSGWRTQTTRSRLMRMVPYPMSIRSRMPYGRVDYIVLEDRDGTCYLVPDYYFLGIDLREMKVTGVYDSCMDRVGDPDRVVMRVRKPKCKADAFYRIEYRNGVPERVFVKSGHDLFLILPREFFVGREFLSAGAVSDFVDDNEARDRLVEVLTGGGFFDALIEKLSPFMILGLP